MSEDTKQRLIIPEVVQTSGMDCGPASLKALLEGFHISASYGRLREACQTDVDGTSINTVEELSNQLGLDAEQVMIPVDHLLLPEAEALPAVIVIRLPSGFTHFVVLWRNHFDRVLQVMDPATGRRWPTVTHFLDQIYRHIFPVPASAWREWAGSEEFLAPLRRRLLNLQLNETAVADHVKTALADPTWYTLGRLDAATRMTDALIKAKAIRKGEQAAQTLASCLQSGGDGVAVPEHYWFVRPVGDEAPDDPNLELNLHGCVLVRIKGVKSSDVTADPVQAEALSPELHAALTEPPPRPGRELWRMIRADGLLTPITLLIAMTLAGMSIAIEAYLFRGLIDIGTQFQLPGQRLFIMFMLLLFTLSLIVLRFEAANHALRLGKELEVRMRMAFFKKVPRLRDQYFHSRPISDMAQRSHNIYKMHELPLMAIIGMRHAFTLIFTTIGIIWLSPINTVWALISGSIALFLPLIFLTFLSERDMRMQTHMGALTRFFLDSLLGLVSIRAHGAEKAVRREHEDLLTAWGDALLNLFRAIVWVEGAQLVFGYFFAILILYNHIQQANNNATILLLTYWTLSLPLFGQQLTIVIRRYPGFRNTTLRLLEPLRAPEDEFGEEVTADDATRPSGAAITMEQLHVVATGHEILRGVDLNIEAGSHIAVVGASGAGKSSLVGLLLGWHRPANGRLSVDGIPLTATKLTQLRQETAWVDPAVQLWNRSFLDNIRYGNIVDDAASHALGMEMIIEQADLLAVLRKLPEGLQTVLGEGGGLLSGGEGQRMRLGRALMRRNARLVILDEPFRGLDRKQRHDLLQRARHLWQDATLLCITHDVSETRNFERVLVMENGRIVEDGSPSQLASQPDSRYRAMLHAEEAVRHGLWADRIWRKWHLSHGQLQKEGGQ